MQDQENQPSFGVVWIKFQEVVEILLFAGILFILLNLVVDIATLSKQLALPFWIWILIRAIICIYGFLICVRVLDAYIRHRWKRSDTEKYCISVVFSATAFALAWTQQGWILAFPSLLIGFIPLFCIEVRRQVITKRSTYQNKKKSASRFGQIALHKQGSAKTIGHSRNVHSAITSSSQKVFICYSHLDERWLQLVRSHLQLLERQGLLDLWDDTKIAAGSIWRKDIEHAISSAAAVIALIDVNFLASDFIMRYELPRLLQCAQVRGTIILPIFVGSCFYEDSGLERFQAVNSPSKPLAEMTVSERDRILSRFAKDLSQRLTTKGTI